jgi:Zn-dependent M28 family amino/carboxypeptidase
MYDDFSEVCEPLKDYNPDIPFEVIKREGEPQARPTSAGGSDHAYFAMNGIPAISFREQDIFGYDFIYRDIWHTEDDLYDKLIPEYLEHSAVVQAVTAYGLANLNHLLSRDGLYKD